MSTPARRFFHHRLAWLVILGVLFLPGSGVIVFAQGGVGSSRGLPGSSGGIHTIQGRVYFPAGQPVTQLRIKLESSVTGANSTATDLDGSFGFRSLAAGTYTIIVEAGPEYEPARETVTIYGTGGFEGRVSPQTVFAPIHLRLKGSSGIDPALAKVPREARELYGKGLESAAKGDSKKAVEQLSGAIAHYPEFPQALSELGLQYLKLAQPDKAADPLKKAVDLSPKDFMARLNYGIALFGKKDYGNAELQLREALKLNVTAPTAHMYLGITLLNLSRDQKTNQFNADRYTEAQKELESAAASDKAEVALAHRYLGGIYWGNKDYKRAADEFELYLKLSPKAADAERIRASVKELRSK